MFVDVVRDYFGETVALYFAFLGFYTKFLIPICLVALFHKFFVNDEQKEENAWFAALNLIWTTVFLEIWKRRCCTISFEWGTLSRNKGKSCFAAVSYLLYRCFSLSFLSLLFVCSFTSLYCMIYFDAVIQDDIPRFKTKVVSVNILIVFLTDFMDISFMFIFQIWTASFYLIGINETLELS